MINAIVGQLVCVNPQSVTILGGSIEFELIISSQTSAKLSALQGSDRNNVRILSYLQHKEDSMVLFGFLDEDERRLFLELIKVNGIGPKQAMKILSGVRVQDFIQALDASDVNFLKRIPGLGAKTSQKIILALRDTLVFTTDSAKPERVISGESRKYEDVIEALVEMGYDKKKVLETVGSLLKDNEEALANKSQSEIEEWLFRSSIVRLS
ncbi:MAG: Holliday junction branch migration protein RuvA [Sphaerochaetaceae bacterium]|nr:Holliday junction branch migration protein RuvA [Sphaerochaetaceae bacterium]